MVIFPIFIIHEQNTKVKKILKPQEGVLILVWKLPILLIPPLLIGSRDYFSDLPEIGRFI